MIGRTFGHYRITDKLGEGGMGVVFLAQDLSLGRKVALKFLSEELRDDPAAHRHQLIEARAAAALDHSGICNIHEIVEAEGQSFIVMEYVDGQSLKERLRAGPLPISETLQIASEVAEALEEAHKGGILHRDLKPANIMLTRKGHAKVMDFGLAKQLVPEGGIESREETITAMTRSRTTVGTLAYMAPEQLRGQPADPRSDVWSLGMVLYEMTAGERPFRGRTAFELSCAILTESPAPLPPHVPPGLRAVIERCLDREPARRYQRGEDLRAALESVRSGAVLRYTEPSRRRSLAVLPLTNLSGDPEQAYFVEGIHEALITDLAKISALRVIARSSSIRCGGAEKSLPEIARELNVDAVLTGSIARSGNRVRVTARLVDAATEEHLWAERYERELHDVLSLQNEIVMSIAREIQLQLTPQEQARLAVARQVNPAAHEAYLKGRFHWYKLSREDFNTALEYFQFALVKDPNYAPAYVGIADVWLTFGDAGFLPAGEAAPKAKAAVLRALELDDALAEAHVTLANVRTLFEWDWAAAETEFRRAIELNPSHANAHLMYADFLISLRRTEEWEAQIRQTLELDPLNFFFQCFYAWHLVYVRRYEAAIAQLRRVLAMQPGFSSAHMGLWGAFYKKTMVAEALAEAREFFAVLGDREIVESLDRGSAENGYCGAMKRAGETLSARADRIHVPAVRIARVFAHAGENERALSWLERAHSQRESPLLHLSVGWDWDGLRGDPRFQTMLRRMNLPVN